MELILKRPENKPPCICILFENTYQASSLNKDWVNSYKGHNYQLVFEIKEGKVDLLFRLPGFGLNYRYEDLKVPIDKLQRFLHDTKGTEEYSFCHIIFHGGKYEVVRTTVNAALWVLKVDSVKVDKEF